MSNRLKYIIIIILTVSSYLESAYLLKEDKRELSKIDNMPKNIVLDMKVIPQDPFFYANQIKYFSKAKQKKLDKEFNIKYFKPWSLKKIDIPKNDLGWEIRFVRKQAIFQEDGTIIKKNEYEKWIDNANYKNIDTKRYKAITIKRTNVKALPIDRDFYRDPLKTGEGFPFDYNQNSALHINIPLYISHFSKDNRWAFIRASYSFGWVKVSDLALTNSSFIKRFKNGNYSMTIKDNLGLYNSKKRVSLVKLGALFPIDTNGRYIIASRSEQGRANIETVGLSRAGILAKKPLAFSARNVARVAKEFYNEPYGWGGNYECRDCSATTRDFLGVFGIFLHRNSSKQAKDGKALSLKKMNKEKKKRYIIKHAKPFQSLLHVPGHIVLYLGAYNNEPVIMHTYWGIRKQDRTKLITARTIITTTEPGKELNNIDEKSKLINTLKSIINF